MRSPRNAHLCVEAGTGVGKSFAYLAPAILAATNPDGGKPPRIVISTHTISLQEQLIRKDLPLLNSVIPREFSAVLVKGRRNYLSLRRMQGALSRGKSLFDDEAGQQLNSIRQWSESTVDGSLADLNYKPLPAVWDEVASDHGNCMGRRCPTYKKCFSLPGPSPRSECTLGGESRIVLQRPRAAASRSEHPP